MGIDSTEKVIRLETNMQKAMDKFKTNYIEQKKYIGRRFSEMEDIILQNAKHQRVEISHLKTEVNETLRKFNASQNLRHLSKPLARSTSSVSSVTKNIEAVENLEKIIKQNF